MKSLPRTGIDRLQNEKETDGFGRPFFYAREIAENAQIRDLCGTCFLLLFKRLCSCNQVDKKTMKLKDELSTRYPVQNREETKNNRKIIEKFKNHIDKTL